MPDTKDLKGKLILADRGYASIEYFSELEEDETSFIIRQNKAMNQVNLSAVTASGKVLKHFAGKRLHDCAIKKDEVVDLEVEWREATDCPFNCRLIVVWDPEDKVFNYVASNLPCDRYTAVDILTAYRLRWQIELLFKEWKSYANLHGFDTSKAQIAEGLIWAALFASTVKRYLAYATQLVSGVEISTRKVSMCAVHVLLEIFVSFARKSPYRLLLAWRHAIQYLTSQARRSHPERVRKSGGFAIGLLPTLSFS